MTTPIPSTEGQVLVKQLAEAMKSDKLATVKFTMADTTHCFRTGHRIMVQVQSSWFPLADRNPQTFCDIYAAKDPDFKTEYEKVIQAPVELIGREDGEKVIAQLANVDPKVAAFLKDYVAHAH